MINGKSYIGKSFRIERRYKEHTNYHLWRTKRKSLLSKAIGKYGIENFSFEIIKECDSGEQMNIDEMYYINLYNTLNPNGYNLQSKKEDKLEMHEDTKALLSKIGQGIRHAHIDHHLQSEFIGVRPSPTQNKYVCSIKIIKKNKTFSSEIEAAEAYDKMVLFIYGENARLNFNNRRDEYISSDLKSFYDFFINPKLKTSQYIGVARYKNTNRWNVQTSKMKRANKIPSLGIGSFYCEIEAAVMVDKIKFFYEIDDNYNFPEKICLYDKKELSEFFKGITIIKTPPKYEGVYKRKDRNKWKAYLYLNRKQILVGNFNTEEEAYIARELAIKKLSK